ncbi:SdrD B-like domain-containing protein [Microbacterium sp. ZW T5_45]|uniref:SdrD B-like domain-containing protein n=1 Tax=Microbacterium sp. ZW T5_45 TaxID=3378080 RepID=UPI003854C6F9
MKKTLAGAAALATAAALSIVAAPAAQAAVGDGTISIYVMNDVNANSTRDAADTPLNNVTVRFTDSDNHTFTRNTNASGQIVLAGDAAGNTLVGGQYRIEVTNPNTGTYTEGRVLDGHAEPDYAPATSFVDVSNGADVALSVGYLEVATLGPSNATIFSAIQPDSIWPDGETKEIYKVPYRLNENVSGVTAQGTTGSVYGIGLDQEKQKIYAGAYAKRGSAYGPGGSGAIYRIDAFTGATEIYATVAAAGTTEHDMESINAAGHETQDYEFRTAVGRESLGDVEVTEDGAFLLAINMRTDSVVVYPVQDAVNPAPTQTEQVDIVGTCAADWAPMALAENDGKIYIGAVCGATSATSVIEYTLSAAGILTPTGVTWTGDPTVTPGRAGVPSPNLAVSATCRDADWLPWSDTVAQDCINNAAYSTPVNPAGLGLAGQFTVPQPMLADIAFTETGGLLLAFRDRGGDQYSTLLYYGTRANGNAAYSAYIATGDVTAACINGSTLDFTCRTGQPATYPRNGDFDDFGGFHNEAAFGGFVHVPGTDRIVANQMDATGLWTNGLRAFNPANGNLAASSTGTANAFVTSDFSKAQGLADMEALVLDATQQIGNRIWLDTDEDGMQDPNEPAVAGVQVSLYDTAGNLIATTETDENGEYWFDTNDGLLPATNYQIRLDRPADFAPGGPLAGVEVTSTATGANRGIDNNGATVDVDGVPTVVANITSPAASRNDHSIDFGFVPEPVSIGDYVWLDLDNDGQQDAGEPVVPNVTVRLLDAAGNEVATTTTDANGYYSFTDLRASSDYTVVFPTTVTVDGNAYRLTDPTRGDSTTDSNPAVDTGNAPVRTPATGDNLGTPGDADDPTIDAGYVPIVSVGDYVWIDADKDGIQDEDELPVPGVTVTLYAADGETVIATTTTDENGYYVFADLPVSTDFIIEFPTTVPVDGIDYPLTDPNQGDDDAADSDANVITGRVEITTPATGQNSAEPGEADDPTIDAGYILPPVSIGDYVWLDADRDGVQDEGESPVPDATVRLLSPDGTTVIATTTTDENGYYAFTDLAPGVDYIVEFPTTVTVDGIRYILTTPVQGDDTASDSNPAVDTGRAPVTTPVSGDNSGEPGEADDPTIDAGYVTAPVSVGDYVWIDADKDGIQDEDELPVPGVTVTLYAADGETVIATTTTDENGYYVFADLPVSTDFIIEFPTTVTINGTDYPLTDPNQGDDDAADSDANPTTGRVSITTPPTGDNSTEPGEADDPTIDAGYILPPVSIGDYVWLDADRDGVQDEGEQPVTGITVTLLDAEGTEIATTTTDENGFYSFTDLDPNTDYSVVFPTVVTVDGVRYQLTPPNQSDSSAVDSNPEVDTGIAPVTTPLNGENSGEPGQADDPTIDAGYQVILVSIGDYVWLDQDHDGIQDEDEVPVSGVTVTLYAADGETVIATTTTDENGYYVFTDLPNSTDFIVEFPTQVTIDGEEYRLTTPGVGDDSGSDSNPDVTTGRTPVTTPVDGSNSAEPGEADDPTIDAGYSEILVSVGDYVWIDADRDGVQDPDEKPISGVEVKLYDADGVLVGTTTTDDTGFYVFTDLKPSTEYTIEFPTKVVINGVEFPLTITGAGTDATGSDADQTTGRVTFTTPATGNNSALPGEVDLPTIDAGFVPPVPPVPPVVEPPLAVTGGAVPWALGGGALLLLLAGAALVLIRRRRAATVGADETID